MVKKLGIEKKYYVVDLNFCKNLLENYVQNCKKLWKNFRTNCEFFGKISRR